VSPDSPDFQIAAAKAAIKIFSYCLAYLGVVTLIYAYLIYRFRTAAQSRPKIARNFLAGSILLLLLLMIAPFMYEALI